MVIYRYMGSGTTDSSGVAQYNYTGTGKGKIQVIASTDRPIGDSSLQSETYEVLDAIIYDDMESDKLTYYHSANNARLSYSSDWSVSGSQSLLWNVQTGDTGNQLYYGWYFSQQQGTNKLPIENLIGKSIRVEITANASLSFAPSNGFVMRAFYKTSSSGSWSQLGSVNYIQQGENTISYNLNVPSNAYDVWIRCDWIGTASNQTLYVDNWKIYPV